MSETTTQEAPSWEELRALLAKLTQERLEERREAEQRRREAEQRRREIDLLLKEQSLAAERRTAEIDRQMQETDRRMKETDQQMKETDQRMKETERFLHEVGRQIGDLGKKFGSFTEGMALPSMERILRERFGMETIAPRVRVKREGRSLELDVLAYANSTVNSVYVVEVKSHLRDDSIDQTLSALRNFPEFFPEHRDKHLYGIVAAVDGPECVWQRALRAGLYVARIHDDEFELTTPEGFAARDFGGGGAEVELR